MPKGTPTRNGGLYFVFPFLEEFYMQGGSLVGKLSDTRELESSLPSSCFSRTGAESSLGSDGDIICDDMGSRAGAGDI